MYDNDTKYLYYNLGTGMPAQGGTNKVYLSLNENKTISYETQKLIKDKKLFVADREVGKEKEEKQQEEDGAAVDTDNYV